MSGAFRISVLYMLCTLVLTAVLTQDLGNTLVLALAIAAKLSRHIYGGLGWLLAALLIAVIFLAPGDRRRRLGSVLLMVALSFFLQTGFLFAKSAIPMLVPFYADPLLARIDQALFFGEDAWRIAHAISSEHITWAFPVIYMQVWSICALGFPLIVAATDPDEARAGRYVWLFILSWFVVGNVLATLGSSVGPIYYDRLLATDRFAELGLALDQSGFTATRLGQLQDRLWAGSSGPDSPLSLISAYPSVHVAVATVVALYLRERAPRFALFGYAFLAMITIISVYSGYHYAVDSLTGWAVVVAIAAALKRRGLPFRRRDDLPEMPAAAITAEDCQRSA